MLYIFCQATADRAVGDTRPTASVDVDRSIATKENFEEQDELFTRQTKHAFGDSFITGLGKPQPHILQKTGGGGLSLGAVAGGRR
jgi:hypothetical protein